MNRKPFALISNDWHLNDQNVVKVINLMTQKANFADKLGVEYIFILGDVFDSRKAQSQFVLTGFQDCLKILTLNKQRNVICIRGNHDSVFYGNNDSYLTPFKHFPNFHLIEGAKSVLLSEFNIDCVFVPFEKEDRMHEVLKGTKRNPNARNVLLTHTSFNGSVNNNGSQVVNSITHDLLKPFDLVLSGHYHNYHQVYKNTYHLPSICQNNFGEDENKGFTVLYDDLSFEIVQASFQRYKTIEYDCETGPCETTKLKKQLDKIVQNELQDGCFVRLKLKGGESLLKTLDVSELKGQGIKVEKIFNEVNAQGFVEEMVEFDDGSIIEKFKEFCDKEGLDVQEGLRFFKNLDSK